MIDESTVFIIASVFVALALVALTLFIYRYARHSPWRNSIVGRTMMYRATGMWTILVYAFTNRWMELPGSVQDLMGLLVWALVALIEVRLVLVLEYIQSGRVTVTNPNFAPVHDWFQRRLARRRANPEKKD